MQGQLRRPPAHFWFTAPVCNYLLLSLYLPTFNCRFVALNFKPFNMSVGISNSEYATKRRRLFDFLARVRAIGYDSILLLPLSVIDPHYSADVDVDIPAIAAIGWQKHRCPTECQLERSDSPWECKPASHHHNGTIRTDHHHKSDVTDRIRRAQRAILSPTIPPDSFLSGNGMDTELEFSFSYNCIVLHISGSDITDLNFIDLPGLFSGGRNQDMELIRNLAVSYIQKPSCIILLTVACETDFVNQGAHRLAKEFDPDGDRTIGVLTKPDRIPPTEEENWLPFIRGEREDTTSWFCVKCPNTQAINEGITWEDARAAESTFFSSSLSWSTLEDAFRQKLGTENLTTSLSNKLCDLIADRLPDIHRDLSQLLEKTNRELADLPRPPSSSPMGEILRLITEFTRDVRKQGEGEPGRDGLLQQIRPWQEAFRLAIRKTAPCFVPRFKKRFVHPIEPSVPAPSAPGLSESASDGYFVRVSEVPLELGPPLVVSEWVPQLSEHLSTSMSSTPMSSPPSGIMSPDYDSPVDTVRPMPVERVESLVGPSFLEGEEHHCHIGLDDGEEIFIDDVLETAEWAVTRELPCNYPFIVQRQYIIERVNRWHMPAQALFDSVFNKLKEMTLCIVDVHFEPYIHGGLKQRMCNIVSAHIDLCSKETSKRIEFILQVEREPFTQNKDYFKDYRRKFLAFYNGLYHKHSTNSFIDRLSRRREQSSLFNSALDSIIANLHRIGFRDVNPLQLAALQPSEDAEDALKIMADVRGYFQVAYKRFVDNVPKAIDEELVLGVAQGLQDALVNGLGLESPDAHERCVKYLAEHPRVAEKRERLLARKNRLELALEELQTVFG
ncbi:P-loop containing nucleoside triphosphate hydrolase protein [Lactifluus volemus]|nr:P-loop containing nucleoside triphosphate hydrolase protein [Lactifluus volemus]